MPVPSVRGSGTAVSATAAGATCAWPTHQAGDIAVLIVEHSGGAATAITPTNWTLLPGSDIRDISTIAGSRAYVYLRRATSGAMPTVALPFPTNADHVLGQIHVVQDVDPNLALASIVAVVSCKGPNCTGVASTTATLPSITTPTANCLVGLIVTRPDDSASTTHYGTPSNAGLTSISAGVEAGTTDGNGGGFVFAWGTRAVAGATGTTTISKTVSTTDTYHVIAFPPLMQGEGDGSIGWVGSATGVRTPKGDGNGAIGWAGTATGVRTPVGAASGAVGWAGSATGARASAGAAAGAVSWAGTVTGARTSSGAASGAVGWAGTVTGSRLTNGAASGAVSWVGSATGARTSAGAVTGAVTWVGSVVGGSSSVLGAITWAGSATGARASAAAASGTITWAGAATGVRSPRGSAVGTIGWAGTAAGSSPRGGTAAGAVSWAGGATGVRHPAGSAVGAITWAGVVAGTTLRAGAASGTVAWVGSATGVRHPGSAAAGAITWAASATGIRAPVATVSGTIVWAAIVIGVRPITQAIVDVTVVVVSGSHTIAVTSPRRQHIYVTEQPVTQVTVT